MYNDNESVVGLNSNHHTTTGRIIKNLSTIKVLARGKNPGSDQLLDWLVSRLYYQDSPYQCNNMIKSCILECDSGRYPQKGPPWCSI